MLIHREDEKSIAFLLANTRKQKRPNNLIEIVDCIERLVNRFGTVKIVSEIVDVSSEMLKKFLSIKNLHPDIQKMFEERTLDSVTIGHLLTSFEEKEQLKIAKQVIAGNLKSDDLKVLVPFKRSTAGLDIGELINKVVSSKNIKVYLIYFYIPQNLNRKNLIINCFRKYIDKSDISFLELKNNVASLGLTINGLKKLRASAKTRKLPLRKFINNILN